MSCLYRYKASADKKDYKFLTASNDLYFLFFTDFILTTPVGDELKILSVGFSCIKNQTQNCYDPKVRLTLISLIKSLFEDDKQSVLFYICLNNDGKAKYRNRKFNQWFRSNDDGYIKHQIIIDDFHCSILLRADHPNLHEIIDAFEYTIKTYWQID